MKKKLLITGISGLLGSNVAYCLRYKYDILGLYRSYVVEMEGIKIQKVDLTSEKSVKEVFDNFLPDIVLHCAAISNVDYCEENKDLAYQVNVLGTRNIVNYIDSKDVKLVHISTDLLYGEAEENGLKEESNINPPNSYAYTKHQAEKESLKKGGALILRTNFFGWNVQDKFSLAEWVVHELSHKRSIKGFDDVFFSSIYTFELAKIIDESIEKDLKGIYNCASSTYMSKNEFASKIASYFRLDGSLIESASIDQADLKAKRRKNLGLDVSKMEKALGRAFPSVEESIKIFFDDYQEDVSKKLKPNNFIRAYPVLDHIPYGRQNIMIDDIKAVVEVLQSNYLTQGPKIAEFEQSIMDVTSSNYCIAVNSGTSALHIACLAALVGPGDEVITSPNTFVASSNAIVYCGAKPIFADIDSKTYNIDPKEIEKKITEKTKAIIPVHFAGQSCDMEEIYNIVKKYEKKYGNKIYIIEDASHALGSTYKDTKIGSCAYSDMVTLSFHPVKHVTTGEGGAVLIKNKEFYKKLKYMRSHGITSDTEEFIYKENAFEKSKTQDSEPMKKAWYYEQICLGFNYRITDIQCALGCSQMKKISRFIDRRREIVNIYNNAFKDIDGITVPFEADYCNSNFHLYVLLFDFKKIGISRSEFMRHLRANDIYTQAHYIPVHTQPFYRENFGTNWGDFLNAEEYYQKCLSIPIYPSMSTKDVDKVISSIKDIVEGKVTK